MADGASVLLSTVNGTATGGSDFTALTNKPVVFPAGKTSVTEFIEILNDAVPEGPAPALADDYAAACLRRMLDHYRLHGFTGSPRVLEALLGRPARTYADHLADCSPVPRPGQAGQLR